MKNNLHHIDDLDAPYDISALVRAMSRTACLGTHTKLTRVGLSAERAELGCT